MSLLPTVHDLWREYQSFRMEVIEQTRVAGLTPGMVADLLESEAARPFRDARFILGYEITAYRRSPNDWRTVALPS